jgi:monoamine oxidase
MSSVDVLIIGGGAAGIAAGRRLLGEKLSVLVVEAADRLGGRAWTRTIDGMTLDMGCGWLHSADRNPWAKLAEEQGVPIDKTPPAWRQQFAQLGFSREEQKEAEAAFAEFDRRLRDMPPTSDRASDLLESDQRWNGYLQALSGFMNGAELGQLSVADYLAFADSDTDVNWRLPDGYGALIEAAAEELPVALVCPIDRIDWDDTPIRAIGRTGTIEARAVIISVSTDVLAQGRLTFWPELPDKVEAASNLPLGLANKAFLGLDRPEPFEPDTSLIGDPRSADTGAYYLRPFGLPVIECFFGGAGARALEAEGKGAGPDFAIQQLVSLFGSGIRRRLRPLAETRWGQDPLILGSYSHALPGRAADRAALARPVEDRLFFAGEACSAEDFSTAHGAYESGVAAAEAVLESLRVAA